MYENFHRRIIIYGSLIYQKSCYFAHFVHPLRANLQPQKKTKLFHKFKRVFFIYSFNLPNYFRILQRGTEISKLH